jgi:predicted amidohydrolase YtcJ
MVDPSGALAPRWYSYFLNPNSLYLKISMNSSSLFIAALCGFSLHFVSAQNADTIYQNGSILTIDDAHPKVQAVAVKDGKILAVGSKDEVFKTKGDVTKVVDLTGKTMLPGFVDAHGHVFMGGIQALSANLLAAPDGDVKDIASLVQTLKDWTAANEKAVDKIQLILGFGYDNSTLAELRHPTREDLDKVSKDIPVIIVHQSAHLFAVNSKALEICGVTAATPNPAGGVIRRRADGHEPDGVLEETAGFPVVMKLLSRIGAEGSKQFARSGTELWARFGYTTAQEGRSTPGVANILRTVADEGGLKIDVVTYADVLVDRDFIKNSVSLGYKNRFRVGGAKLTIDGSPQGFTAWRDRPYYAPVGNYPPGYRGYPAATEEQVISAIDWAYENKVQIITHSNGEAASDLLIAAIDAATRKHGAGDRRSVLIHGQFLREDQLDQFNRLSVIPSLFPMHTFYWGDWHREHTVGPLLADNISPTGWCVKRGMRFTSHHDAPVAFPNSMRVLDATVTRRSRSGDIIGADQRVDVMTALKSMTIWPAWQHFEEKSKGSIETGKLADLVILDKDPTAIDPELIDEIKVVETIKEGVTIFDIANMKKAGASIQSGNGAELSLVRAVTGAAAHLGQDHHDHDQADGSTCLCTAMSKLAATIAGGESH